MPARRPPARLARPAARRSDETDFQTAVLGHVARFPELRAFHVPPVQIRPGVWVTPLQGDGKGWVDLFIAGPGGQLFRELKSATGRVDPEQQTWMDRLAEGGADVAVWRPADLLSGRITRELTAIKRPRRTPTGVGDMAAADAAVFRSALEQIRDADPTSTAARIAADALIRQHHAAKEAVRG